MPINYDTVRTNLYAWANSQVPTGMPVIFYQPNAPRPNVPYVTLYLNSISQINQDWSSEISDDEGTIEMKGDRTFILQIQAYGNDPLTVLENLRTSLQKQSVLDTLRVSGIAFYQALDINDITDLVDSEFERRAQMDVRFAIGQVYQDAPGYFDTVEIQEQYKNSVGTIVYDETITITAP